MEESDLSRQPELAMPSWFRTATDHVGRALRSFAGVDEPVFDAEKDKRILDALRSVVQPDPVRERAQMELYGAPGPDHAVTSHALMSNSPALDSGYGPKPNRLPTIQAEAASRDRGRPREPDGPIDARSEAKNHGLEQLTSVPMTMGAVLETDGSALSPPAQFDRLRREFGRPVQRIPDGGPLQALFLRVEADSNGRSRAVLVTESAIHIVSGLNSATEKLAGREVVVTRMEGAIRLTPVRAQRLERGR